MVTFATLCYVMRGNRILLQHKAKGLFGEGLWNAPGGKLLKGEAPEEAARREVYEETRLKVKDLVFNGVLNFYLGDSRVLDQTVFLFSCRRFSGRMQASSEGELKWFASKALPYNEMWADDRHWLPLLIHGTGFVGDFYFTQGYGKFVSHRIRRARFKSE